ncbi:MAG: hypothetical protein ACLFVU_14385 [Phycisphaerae bacterium]
MKDNKNTTILLLLISAVLLGGLMIGLNNTDPARAETEVRRGEYVMTTGQYNDSTDFLYVLDLTAQKMNVYYVDEANKKSIVRVTVLDLKRAFQE